MQIREQYYTNKRRIYYHGSKYKDLSKGHSKWPWFFITTNLEYAIGFAKEQYQDWGYVYSFNLTEKLNIWNGQSNIDYKRIENFDYLSDKDKESLKKGLDISILSFDRKQFAKDLQDLGYDGFFSFEYTNIYYERNDLSRNAIGLFNMDKLIKRNIYSFDELMAKSESFYSRVERSYNNCIRTCSEHNLFGQQNDPMTVNGLSKEFKLLPLDEIRYILEHEKPVKVEPIKEANYGNILLDNTEDYRYDSRLQGKKII